MKYYIIAGEASGDLHGSNLIKELKNLDSNLEVRCWGGDLMQQQGATLVKHYKELAFMGFKEVLVNIKTIFKNISFCKEDIAQYKPDVVIFIDYPGFNLRIAEYVKSLGIKTIYYISPQVWAWKENRVKKIKQTVDQMICILPFEKDFYKKWDYPSEYVGHPLLDAIKTFEIDTQFREKNKIDSKPIIALLPGSRKQEISKMLPLMLELSKLYTQYNFVVAAAPGQTIEYYQQYIHAYNNCFIVKNQTYQLLHHSHAALVTSGTATLETALFDVPQIVCYKGSNISYQIGKRLVKIKYISLVNLILDKPTVTELIQNDYNLELLKVEFAKITVGKERQQILNDYILLKNMLGNSGASKKAAEIIYKQLV
ncbi:MAG: lipid-A-disaccharide synthase [Bacteroidetes bacterium]|nr:lipid-A-disaccharide synthase [Bacteroidota bacterium]